MATAFGGGVGRSGALCGALAGADAIVLETFVDPWEARAALHAATATGLPVVFQVGHTGRGRNRWTTIDVLLAEAEAAGAAAVGANCQHPDDIVDVAAYLISRTRLPVTASANAGNPSIERGLVRYEFTPEDFAEIAGRLAALGVSVIGGCCGTTGDKTIRPFPRQSGSRAFVMSSVSRG